MATTELDLALQLAKHAVRLDCNNETVAAVDAYERVVKLMGFAVQEEKDATQRKVIETKRAEYTVRMLELKGLHFASQACEYDAIGQKELALNSYQQTIAAFLQLSKTDSPAAQVVVERLTPTMRAYMQRAEELHAEVSAAKLSQLSTVTTILPIVTRPAPSPNASVAAQYPWQPTAPVQGQPFNTQQAQHRKTPRPPPQQPHHPSPELKRRLRAEQQGVSTSTPPPVGGKKKLPPTPSIYSSSEGGEPPSPNPSPPSSVYYPPSSSSLPPVPGIPPPPIPSTTPTPPSALSTSALKKLPPLPGNPQQPQPKPPSPRPSQQPQPKPPSPHSSQYPQPKPPSPHSSQQPQPKPPSPHSSQQPQQPQLPMPIGSPVVETRAGRSGSVTGGKKLPPLPAGVPQKAQSERVRKITKNISKLEFDEADFHGENIYDLSTTCELDLTPEEQRALVQPFVEAVNQNKTLRQRYTASGKSFESFAFVREYYENYAIARQSQQELISQFESNREEERRKQQHQQQPQQQQPQQQQQKSGFGLKELSKSERGKKIVLGLQNAKGMLERLARASPYAYAILPEEKSKSIVDEEWLKELEASNSSEYKGDLIAGHLISMLRNKDHSLGRRVANFANKAIDLCHNPKDPPPIHLEEVNNYLRNGIVRLVHKIVSRFHQLQTHAYLVKMTVQYILFNLIFQHLFELYKRKYLPEDTRYAKQFDVLIGYNDPIYFFVRPQLCLTEEGYYPYESAILAMRKISTLKTPLEKCNCLNDASQEIIKCLDEYRKRHNKEPIAVGADDLLPIYTYVVAQARITNVYSELMFLNDWLSERALVGEEGYNFATFETALMSTLQMDPSTMYEEMEKDKQERERPKLLRAQKEKELQEKEKEKETEKGKEKEEEGIDKDIMTEEQILSLMEELVEPVSDNVKENKEREKKFEDAEKGFEDLLAKITKDIQHQVASELHHQDDFNDRIASGL